MILFLDFDGVLHPGIACGPALFSARHLIWQLLDACPHIEVVFSTSWRETHPVPELTEFVTAGGGEHHAGRFIGTLPSVLYEAGRNIAGPVHQRENAINAWLTGNDQPVRNWIALDDDKTGFTPACPNLIWIDKITGLKPDDMANLIMRCQQ